MTDPAKPLTDEERASLVVWAAKHGLGTNEIAFARHEGELIERYELTINADRARIAELEDQAADDRTWLVERDQARTERDTLCAEVERLVKVNQGEP